MKSVHIIKIPINIKLKIEKNIQETFYLTGYKKIGNLKVPVIEFSDNIRVWMLKQEITINKTIY